MLFRSALLYACKNNLENIAILLIEKFGDKYNPNDVNKQKYMAQISKYYKIINRKKLKKYGKI